MKLIKLAGLGAILLAFACGNGQQSQTDARDSAEPQTSAAGEATKRREALSRPPAPVDVLVPDAKPRRGRILFITNGCVICHQINGVGGAAAPALDQPGDDGEVNPLEFSARMWRGATAMTALQSIELGYVIQLDGQDIADIAAFTASSAERSLLTVESVPTEMRDWFLDTPYWRMNDWSEYRERGNQIPLEEEPY